MAQKTQKIDRKTLHKPETPPGVQPPTPKKILPEGFLTYVFTGAVLIAVLLVVNWVQHTYFLISEGERVSETSGEAEEDAPILTDEEIQTALESLTPELGASSPLTTGEIADARSDLTVTGGPETDISEQSDSDNARGVLSQEAYESAMRSLEAPPRE